MFLNNICLLKVKILLILINYEEFELALGNNIYVFSEMVNYLRILFALLALNIIIYYPIVHFPLQFRYKLSNITSALFNNRI